MAQTPAVLNSPSACGHTSAYTSLPWVKSVGSAGVRGLANSVLIEWVNNNNNFCKRGATEGASLKLAACDSGAASQQFVVEADGSIRLGGSAAQCLDVDNCGKVTYKGIPRL